MKSIFGPKALRSHGAQTPGEKTATFSPTARLGGFDLSVTLELFSTQQVEEGLNTFTHLSRQKALISFSVPVRTAKLDVCSYRKKDLGSLLLNWVNTNQLK